MAKRIEQLSDSLLDHYLVVSLLLALIILTQVGVGNIKIVSLLGLLLCAIGILQRNITVDLWIFIPLVLYTLIGTVSSWRVYGNITDGHGGQAVFWEILMPWGFFWLSAGFPCSAAWRSRKNPGMPMCSAAKCLFFLTSNPFS